MDIYRMKGCVQVSMRATKVHTTGDRAHVYLDFSEAQEIANQLMIATMEEEQTEPVITEDEWYAAKQQELVREEAVFEYARKKED